MLLPAQGHPGGARRVAQEAQKCRGRPVQMAQAPCKADTLKEKISTKRSYGEAVPLKFSLRHTYDLRVPQKGQAVWRRKSTPVCFFMSARASWRGLCEQAERGSRLGHHDRVRIVDGEANPDPVADPKSRTTKPVRIYIRRGVSKTDLVSTFIAKEAFVPKSCDKCDCSGTTVVWRKNAVIGRKKKK